MAKYLIHAIPSRMWYVEKFLVPSMVAQGIDKDNILVFNDKDKLGNLKAFCESIKDLKGDYWHLQDDVIISSNFKEQTEKYDLKIICGFCSKYSEGVPGGVVKPQNMWYSFPCIRIPRTILAEFLNWLDTDALKTCANWINANKYDDSLFKEFMETRHPRTEIFNLKPNIVNHIDYLIGGSVANERNRADYKKAMSIYWTEPELLDKLQEDILGNTGEWVKTTNYTAVRRPKNYV